MKSIPVIFFILIFDLLAFTIVLPLFPSIIDYYDEKQSTSDSSDYWLNGIHQVMEWIRVELRMPDRRRYNSVLVGGILGSLFSFLQFLSSPIVGACSDVFGRKSMLLLTMVGTSLSYLVWWEADTFTLFLVSRVLGGLTKGSVLLCTTMMTDVTNKENRAKGMAFIGLSFSLAFITGPLIGAYFAMQKVDVTSNAFVRPAQVSLFFQLVSFVIALFVLEETLDIDKVQSFRSGVSKASKWLNPFALFTFSSGNHHHLLKKLSATNFLYLLLFSGLEFTLTFLTHDRFNFNSMQQGKLFFFSGFVMMCVQGGYVRRMKHKGEKKICLQGMAAIIPAMLLISVVSTVQMTYVALLLYSFGAGTVVPCLTSIFSQLSDDKERGENMGKFRSVGALARAFAPALTCLVYWSLGSTVCYAIGAVMFLLPLILLATADVKLEKST